MKELISAEETQIETNEDFQNKLRSEIEKHNTLLDELIQLKENLKITKEKFTETTALVEKQDEAMKELKETINTKQNDVNSKLEVVEAARKVNNLEGEKNKQYAKAQAALKAKLEFIEQKYDYSSSAKQMSLQDFKELIQSNLNVNSTVDTFTSKLDGIQKEINKIETEKQMMH